MHFRVTVWTSQGQQVLGPGDSDGNWCRPQPSLRKTWKSWDSFVFRSTLNISNRNNLTIISQPQASLKVLFKSIWILLRLDLHDELCRVFFCLVELLGKRKQAAFKTELSWLQAVLRKKNWHRQNRDYNSLSVTNKLHLRFSTWVESPLYFSAKYFSNSSNDPKQAFFTRWISLLQKFIHPKADSGKDMGKACQVMRKQM